MTDWQRPNVEAPLIVWEYAQSLERHCDALTVERETLREALIRCAEIAGADGEAIAAARSGAMKHPTVAEFAVGIVLALRQDYDDALGGDKP